MTASDGLGQRLRAAWDVQRSVSLAFGARLGRCNSDAVARAFPRLWPLMVAATLSTAHLKHRSPRILLGAYAYVVERASKII